VSAPAPVLELIEASAQYRGSPAPQIERVSLRVEAGECLALVGPNGAGKTTALRALLGLVPLSAGSALALGRPVGGWKRPALATAIAAVGQREEPVFPTTVEEAVAMGRYPHLGPWRRPGAKDKEAVRRAMERTDVVALAHRWVQTLSGGEWQRVRLARALAQEPQVLVLDEPTASLDLKHEMELFELVVSLVKERGMAALIVSHHLNAAARFADRLALLAQGRLIAADVPERVLVPKVLSDVFGWPVDIQRLPDGAIQLYPQRRPTPPGAVS